MAQIDLAVIWIEGSGYGSGKIWNPVVGRLRVVRTMVAHTYEHYISAYDWETNTSR